MVAGGRAWFQVLARELAEAERGCRFRRRLERRSEFGADFFVRPSVAEPFRAIGVFGLKNENAIVGTDEVDLCEGSANLCSGGFAYLF